MAKSAQVFLCYARDDWSVVEPIYARLVGEFRPWVDRKNLRPGDRWRSSIPAAIRNSQFFLVLLTKRSTNKRGYLQKEIKEALDVQDELADQGRYVIPVRLERCVIPDRLKHIQSADLFEADGWQGLLEILREETPSEDMRGDGTAVSDKIARAERLAVGGVRLPCFFPSVSSAAKNAFDPIDHLRILVSVEFPQFLISSYDLDTATQTDKVKIGKLLLQAASKGQVILLDSGLYEKKWLSTKGWTKERFRRALGKATCHIAFCYDNPDPPVRVERISTQVIDAVTSDKEKSKFEAIAPIVHTKKSGAFPEICARVAERLTCPLIAVPERELGEGVLECATTIAKIRSALNRLGTYVPLHILGTGNPLSILIYSWAGADSFDGLDWCQTVADHETGRLYHSLQLDFFAYQTEVARDSEMEYMTRLLAHNLEFYQKWMSQIQEAIEGATMDELLRHYLRSDFVDLLEARCAS